MLPNPAPIAIRLGTSRVHPALSFRETPITISSIAANNNITQAMPLLLRRAGLLNGNCRCGLARGKPFDNGRASSDHLKPTLYMRKFRHVYVEFLEGT